MAVRAGCDLVLLRGDMEHFMDGYQAILKAARSGEIPMCEIDEAVRRILKAKEKLGLFARPFVEPKCADEIVGCEEHKKVARRLAEKSVTLLKNDGRVIPLASKGETKVLVVSVEPQKIGAAQDPVQAVDMLIKAVQAEYGRTEGKMLTLNPTSEEIAAAVKMAGDVDVVVVGTCNAILYARQIELVRALKATGKTIVVVAMESPYDIVEFPEIATYVCTYGCAYDAMAAAAKVIFGKLQARGKLPVTMPKVSA
jgi:beta-N-acetylhexosaminidase